jgi:DNA-binding MarR family transcriptional regulator
MTRRPSGLKPARQAVALLALFDATAALFHRLRATAALVHGQGELTAARRGVLRGLQRLGPQTVPQMARRHPVSRQHIQLLVNALRDEGLVDTAENPAHRRSSLVRLTPKGRAAVEAMLLREARLLAATPLDLRVPDLERATQVLARVRESLESPRWMAAARRR